VTGDPIHKRRQGYDARYLLMMATISGKGIAAWTVVRERLAKVR